MFVLDKAGTFYKRMKFRWIAILRRSNIHTDTHIHFSTLQFPSIVKGHNEPISIINNNNKCWCPFNLIWVQSLDTLFSIHLNIQLIRKCFIFLKVFFLLFCDVSGSLFCGCVRLNTLQQWINWIVLRKFSIRIEIFIKLKVIKCFCIQQTKKRNKSCLLE